jgi:hypothetical protein
MKPTLECVEGSSSGRSLTDKPAILGGKPVRTDPYPKWPIVDQRDIDAAIAVIQSGRWGGAPYPCETPTLQKRCVVRFTENIPYYMHLADFFIGKPGNISVSEAIAMRLPVIVERNWATMPQERDATDWIEQQGVGLVLPSFRMIHKAVETLIEPKKFAYYCNNVAAIRNLAVFEVSHTLHENAAIILAAFASGWIAARLGWRFLVISGLTMAGVAILALTHINASTEYEQILWNLILSGFGGGLAIAPLTSAAMNTVPLSQEGIASAVCNIGIQFGGILGIAIQGALFTRQFTIDLQRSLAAWNLPSNLQRQIISNALHHLADIPGDLPTTVSRLVLQQHIKNAFVSGLHTTFFVAGFALLIGSSLILVVMPSKLKAHSHF